MLIQGTEQAERRTLTLVGITVVVCATVAGLLVLGNPFGGRASGKISITIDTPYVGQGVTAGSRVVMNGVTVGEVTTVSSRAAGGVRLSADLQKKSVTGLTDTMQIDFRPINYFGVTGISVNAGNGGQALHDGMQLSRIPTGNFTLQALLSRLGEVSTGVLSPQLISVAHRATRYTDALNPLIETALVAATTLADVQAVSTARLLAHAAGLSVVMPSAIDALLTTGSEFLHDDRNIQRKAHGDVTEEEWQNLFIPTDELASGSLFAAIGKLESSHATDLRPVIDALTAVTATVPPLIRPEGFARLLADLRSRFEKMYAGTGEQPALQVQLILDSLPGVAAPLGAMGWSG